MPYKLKGSIPEFLIFYICASILINNNVAILIQMPRIFNH